MYLNGVSVKRLTSCLGVGLAKIKVCTCISISLEYLLYLFKLTLSTVSLASNTDLCILAKKANKRKSDLRPGGGRACFVRVKSRQYIRVSRPACGHEHKGSET